MSYMMCTINNGDAQIHITMYAIMPALFLLFIAIRGRKYTLKDRVITAKRFLQPIQTKNINRTIVKARFWQQHVEDGLSQEQTKVLNRLLDGDFELGISAGQYQKVAKVSKATATRHLSHLLDKNCLEKLPGGGRSTRYVICTL